MDSCTTVHATLVVRKNSIMMARSISKTAHASSTTSQNYKIKPSWIVTKRQHFEIIMPSTRCATPSAIICGCLYFSAAS